MPTIENSDNSSTIHTSYQTQKSAMEARLEKAKLRNDTKRVEIWTKKLNELESKYSEHPQPIQVPVEKNKNNFSQKLKNLYRASNFIYRTVIHPAISNYDSAKIDKIESVKPEQIENYRIKQLINLPAFLECISDENGNYQKPLLSLEFSLLSQSGSDPTLKEYLNHIDFTALEQKIAEIQSENPGISAKNVLKLLNAEYKVDVKDKKILAMAEERDHVEKLIEAGKATKFHFYNSKLEQLEAVTFHPPNHDTQNPAAKTILFSAPNLGSLENSVDTAQELANKFGVNVVLYNGPGMMYSMGKEINSDDAVDAFRAVYEEVLQQNGNDPKKLAVIGHSFGGGASANGLNLIKEENLPSVFASLHSFSSLSRVGAGYLGSGKRVHRVLKKIVQFLDIGNLNSAKVMKHKKLADNVVVIHTPQDGIVRGKGQLKTKLEEYQKKNLEVPNFEVLTVDHSREIEGKKWYQKLNIIQSLMEKVHWHNDRTILTATNGFQFAIPALKEWANPNSSQIRVRVSE